MSIEPREKFRRARVLHDWTQRRCDDLLGVTPGRIQSWERGRAVPVREDLAPFAKEWGIALDWFFNGVDDLPPFGDRSLVASPQKAPIMGHLPSRSIRGNQSGMLPVRVGFTILPGSHYRKYANNLGEDSLKRGDLLLVAPTDLAFSDTLAVIESGGISDVYQMTGIGDLSKPVPIAEGQHPPGSEWQMLGLVVEIQRPLPDGLTMALEREMGLTLDDLRHMNA